jgi:hypothetical protein
MAPSSVSMYTNTPGNGVHGRRFKARKRGKKMAFSHLSTISMLSVMHHVSMPKKGDFHIDNKYTFEIRG